MHHNIELVLPGCSFVAMKTLILLVIRIVVVVELLFYVHGKHLRPCRDGQLT